MLTLYDLYSIAVKDRVYVVDKMDVECWGQLLMLIKIWIEQGVEAYGKGYGG